MNSAGPDVFDTSLGPVRIPIEFRRCTMLHALYRAPVAAAKIALLGSSLVPWTVLGRAFVVLTMFDYRDTSIGPYRELSVNVLATTTTHAPRSAKQHLRFGFFVHQMPLTSELGCAVGREAWGFPKWVTDIRFERGSHRLRAEVASELTWELDTKRSVPVPLPLASVVYSRLGDVVLETPLAPVAKLRIVPGTSVKLEVTGNGPLATSLRALGIPDSRPVLGYYSDDARFDLARGKVVQRLTASS